jgi:hypothetical protein
LRERLRLWLRVRKPRGAREERRRTLNSQLSEDPPVCAVYLTDLDGSFPAKEPEYPVLWCVPPGMNANRKVPFGEIVAVK